ncbi:MAG: thioether cross-link-forming SCIFF peptide maturase [Clostridia bacterium]
MVHSYRLGGYNIVADVESGAVHVLDDTAFDLIGRLTPPLTETCPKGENADAYAEIYALYKDEMLFSSDDYYDKSRATMENPPLKALCLHIAHDCNLRCEYCFASTGDFGTGRKLMPPEIAKAAIDFVIARSQKRRNIEVDFFGGEPLMAFDTVKETVEYAKEQGKLHDKTFRFTITTNGLALDSDKIEYINREMSNVVLSLDGRAEVNDRLRKTVNGDGSYKYIVPKFKELVASRDDSRDYYIRGTFTRDNLDFMQDVLHIADLGFKHLSVEPVVGEADSAYSIKEQDMPAIFAEYERLAELMKERKDFDFFHFTVDLEQGPCIIKRIRGCGAGYEYAAVTPDGDVYPCHQFVGKDEYCMGNVQEGTFDHEISKKFMSLNVCTRKECQTCWARYYCSGGCSAANLNTNGNLETPYELGCELLKKRLECAIMLKVHAAVKGK